MDKSNLETDLLPGRIKELADVIGITAALKLVEIRGGIRMTVPKLKPKANHWLLSTLSDDELDKLISYYGGETIEIDRCAAALRLIFEKQVIQEHRNGLSNSMLARKYGYTERGIRKLRARVEDRPIDTTADIFEFFNGERL